MHIKRKGVGGYQEPMITSEAVNRAIDYILEHLEEDLSLEKVAMHCHFSKYYFFLIYKNYPSKHWHY